MKTWRVVWNAHKYGDLSDSPQHRVLRIRASSRENAEEDIGEWRTRNDENGVTMRGGNRWYIGLIHWHTLEIV